MSYYDREMAEELKEELVWMMSSECRLQLLLDAREGLTTEEIEQNYYDRDGYNQGTVQDNIDELIENQYLERRDGEVTLGRKGSYIRESLLPLMEDVETIVKTDTLYDYTEDQNGALPDLEMIEGDLTEYREEHEADRTIVERYAHHLDASETLQEVSPFLLGLAEEDREQTIDGDISPEYVFPEDFYEQMIEQRYYREGMIDRLRDGDTEFQVTTREVPCMVSVFDNAALFINKNGIGMNLMLEVTNKETIEHAREYVEDLKDDARQVVLTEGDEAPELQLQEP